MATRTSSQTGLWSSTSTWGGAAVPGDGDDFVIAATHVVTVAATVTVGNSAATGTNAGIIRGSLVVNAVLTLRGGLSQERTGSVTVSRVGANTGGITFDPASGTTYSWVTPNTGTGTPSITFTGEAGDLVPITTSLGRSGNRTYFDLTGYPPTLNWSYTNITEWGGTDSSTVATRAMTYTGVSGSSITWAHVRFSSNIGPLYFNLNTANFTFDAQYCDWRSNRSSDWLQINNDTVATSGTRRFLGCTFHSAAASSIVYWAAGFSFIGGVYSNTKIAGDLQDINFTVSAAVVMNDVTITGGVIGGRGTNGMLVDGCAILSNCDNPHYITNSGSAGGATPVVSNCMVDGFAFIGSDAGDFYLGSGGPITLDRILLINHAGSLYSNLDASARMTAKRCTLYGADTFINAGESVNNASNLVRLTSSLMMNQPNALTYDILTPQTGFTCDYNGYFGQTTGLTFGGHNTYLKSGTWWSTGAYGDNGKGQHDVYGDPQFAAPTRTTVTWYNSLFGSGGTFSTVRQELISINGTAVDGTDRTWDSRVTVAALLTYVRAGFTPTNPIYALAGSPTDGSVDIGAVAMAVTNTANVFSSGWELATGTAATCNADINDPLTDHFLWNGDYGPGSGAVCSATPPIARLDTVVIHGGTKSMRIHYKVGDGANGPDFRISRLYGQEYGELWFSWYQYWDANWVWAAADHKMVIVGAVSPSFSQDVYFNIRGNGVGQSGRFIVANQTADAFFRDVGTAGNVIPGVWNHFEAHIVSGTHGSMEARVNGVQLTLSKEAGSGTTNVSDINTGPSLGYIKLDTTYNDFATFESNVVGGSSNTYYDDVGVSNLGWIGDVAVVIPPPPAATYRTNSRHSRRR